MFEIKNLEPESALGFSKNVYIADAYLPILEGFSAFVLVDWDYIDPAFLVIGIIIYFVVIYILLGWFFKLMQKGSVVAVIIQSILLPIALGTCSLCGCSLTFGTLPGHALS